MESLEQEMELLKQTFIAFVRSIVKDVVKKFGNEERKTVLESLSQSLPLAN